MTHYKAEGANGTNVGSRMYLLEDESNYKMFNLLNKEFTFTIDTSNLPCGLNGALYFVEMQKSRHVTPYLTAPLPHISGALYFVEMQQDGGVSEYSTNAASRWGAMSRPFAPV